MTIAASEQLKKADQPPLVLHVISGLGTGGAELMLSQLVRNSRQFCHMVVSLTDMGTIGPDLVAAGIEVAALGIRSGFGLLGGLARLALLIRCRRPMVVQTWLYHADLLGTLAARLAGCQNLIWNLRCSNMDNKRYGRLVALLARLSAVPKAIIANSHAGKEWHQACGYHPRQWRVIANGIDTNRFRPAPEARTRWRAKLGFDNGKVLVGMVARLDPMKDHAAFLGVAARLSSSRPDMAFLVAGLGTDTLPDIGVIRLGEVRDVPGLYSALDIAVQASRFGEGFPNVVAEAMACGVPVIASKNGDVSLIVGDTGLTIPPGDEGALEQAIRALADAPEKRREMGLRAQRKIEHDYALPAAIQSFEAMWREVAAAKG